MRVAIVGLGMAGATLACLLADRGVDVEVVEQEDDPRPVGAGIWLQQMGQQVLERLDLIEPLRSQSRTVTRVDIRSVSGRSLVDVGYDDVPGTVAALGVHRGTLFSLLHDAVRRRGVPVRLGVRVSGVRPVAGGIAVETPTGDLGTWDLVVGGDGSRSPVRRSMNLTVRDHPYDYGALWSIVDDPDGLSTDALFQCLRGTREYLGVLPTGLGRASVFWSEPCASFDRVLSDGLDAWRERAAPLALEYAPLLERVDHLLPASYRDVVVRSPYRVAGSGAAVLVGDAAHAMSPQLGTGTSLALADAWCLHQALATSPSSPPSSSSDSLEAALASYARGRAAHVRWYQWWTRLMMPVFQSSLTPLSWPRDLMAPHVVRAPGMTSQMVTTLLGDRTSPWSQWRLPELD